jgi:hypothetical protein
MMGTVGMRRRTANFSYRAHGIRAKNLRHGTFTVRAALRTPSAVRWQRVLLPNDAFSGRCGSNSALGNSN